MDFNNLIGQTFHNLKFNKIIGQGSFGRVFEAQNINSKKKYAIKVQLSSTKSPLLNFQADVYRYIERQCQNKKKSQQLVPKYYGFFQTKYFFFLVTELCQQNLYDFFKTKNKRIQIKEILKYAKLMLQSIRFLHSLNIIHRDIKPENFIFQNSSDSSRIFILDFGLSKKITKNNQHIKNKQKNSFIGTTRYASINAHENKMLSKRDDLESFMYIIIYFMQQILPWQKVDINNENQKKLQIGKLKKIIETQQLCKNLPVQIQKMLNYIKDLNFNQNPNYIFLSNCLSECINNLQFSEKNEKNQINFKIQDRQNCSNIQDSYKKLNKNIFSSKSKASRIQIKPRKYLVHQFSDDQDDDSSQSPNQLNQKFLL